jgi:hypothetical protein
MALAQVYIPHGEEAPFAPSRTMQATVPLHLSRRGEDAAPQDEEFR